MRYLVTFIFSLLFLCLNAQGFRTHYYPRGSLTSVTKAIFETTPGSYLAAGITVDSLTGSNRLCIMGLDAQGQILWKKLYGTSQFQYLHNNLIARSFYKQGNNLYYTGCVRDSNNRQIGVLIQFSLNGDTLWQKIYRDPDPTVDVIPQMLTGSVDGGFLLTGFFAVNVATSYRNCMLIKTDINGNELWRRKIGKAVPNVQDGKAIVQDSTSKKIVIVGYQYIGNATSWGNFDNVLILDSLGVKLNQQNYAGFGVQGVLLDLVQTSDKKMVAVGFSIYEQTNMGTYELYSSYIVKFDLNNPTTPIWKINNFDGLTFGNGFYCLTELKNSEVLVGGFLDTMQLHNLPANCLTRLTKIDQNGNVTWNRYYDYKINSPGTDNYQEIKSLNLCSDGSWIGGIECLNSPAPNPFFFVKWDSTGCDTTEAYCRLFNNVGVKEIKFSSIEISIFPNPTNAVLNIRVGNAIENMTFRLTDITGRLIKETPIVSETQLVDLRDLVNGVYLVTVTKNKKTVYEGRILKQD